MTNYIYALHCPIANTVRYIGKTNNPDYRFASHLTSAKSGKYSHYTAKWLRKVLAAGLRPTMEILEELDDAEPWEEYERFYIQFGEEFGWRLTNTNPGGEGGGFVRAEDKAKWAAAIRASYTPEVRAKMSERLKQALDNPRTKALHRENMKRRWENPEYRMAMQEASVRVNANPEVRAKRSAESTSRMADPAARVNVSEKLKAFYATEEGKQNKLRVSNAPAKKAAASQAGKSNWATPEARAKTMAAITAPEVVAKASEKSREQWADPAMKEKMREGLRRGWEKRKARTARTPAEEAVWREERLAKRRQKRAEESSEVREARLAERRAQRKAAKLALAQSAP